MCMFLALICYDCQTSYTDPKCNTTKVKRRGIYLRSRTYFKLMNWHRTLILVNLIQYKIYKAEFLARTNIWTRIYKKNQFEVNCTQLLTYVWQICLLREVVSSIDGHHDFIIIRKLHFTLERLIIQTKRNSNICVW